MLLTGIIILTSYLTKAYNNSPCSKINKNSIDEDITIDDQFNYRPTQIFDAMFNKPSLWQGYQSLQSSKNKNI